MTRTAHTLKEQHAEKTPANIEMKLFTDEKIE